MDAAFGGAGPQLAIHAEAFGGGAQDGQQQDQSAIDPIYFKIPSGPDECPAKRYRVFRCDRVNSRNPATAHKFRAFSALSF